jgi:hypothetical protein
MSKQNWLSVLAASAMLAGTFTFMGDASLAQGNSQTFPETGKTVSGKFLTYWNSHGGLAQQGFPISNEFTEVSDVDGRSYTVQYFERAVFEYHPEKSAPYDVLLSLLGAQLLKQTYPNGVPAAAGSWDSNSTPYVTFPQTGQRVGGAFIDYWINHGGLAQQGYPLSDLLQERSNLDGKLYYVQYFERAVFEFHLEQQPQYQVLLSQLGTFRYRAKHSSSGGEQNGEHNGAQQGGGQAPETVTVSGICGDAVHSSSFFLAGGGYRVDWTAISRYNERKELWLNLDDLPRVTGGLLLLDKFVPPGRTSGTTFLYHMARSSYYIVCMVPAPDWTVTFTNIEPN